MAEPTLSMNFRDLYLMACESLFVTRAPTTAEEDECKRLVNSAYRDFLAEHDWSFLYPGATLFVATQPAVAATGTISIAAGNAIDGNTVTIDDGSNTETTFEFDTGGEVTGGNVTVTIGADAAATMVNLIAAINAITTTLTVTATASAAPDGNCTLANDTAGILGNAALAKEGSHITITGMSGGLSAGARTTDLPDNFGRLLLGFSAGPGIQPNRISEITSDRLRALRSESDAVSVAGVCAIEPVISSGMRRARVLWYPAFESEVTLYYQYSVLPEALSSDTDYPMGGEIHNSTIEAAVLQKIEDKKGQTSGTAHRIYERRLQRSLERDNEARPKNLGPMTDGSDNASYQYGGSRGLTTYTS